MATNGRPNKVMSSRLAGMKFMQRSGPPSPATPIEPPAKKQRLSSGAANVSPASSPATATDSKFTGRDDSKWYLSFRAPQAPAVESPLRIVQAGYAVLDSASRENDSSDRDEEVPSRPSMPGRKSFGKFNKVIEKQNNPDMSSGSESESEEDDEDEEDEPDAEDDTGIDALIAQGKKEATARAKAERKAKRKAEKEELQKLAEQRRKKEVNLNRTPTSISNGGGASPITCHRCNEKGHRQADCPQKRNGGRPSKLRKSY